MAVPQPRLFRLKGKVQHYPWGGIDYLPGLLGMNNTARKPFAEYWMGAHERGPATIGKQDSPLHEAIADDPLHFIGAATHESFGSLPYLLKVLDVKDMLSIQVHPTLEGAREGFAREEATGIPIGHETRNYKDRNHKPEVMVALSDFWLLHGFLPEEKMTRVLEEKFPVLAVIFKEQGYKGLYRHVMELPEKEADRLLIPVLEQDLERRAQGLLSRDDAGWWAAEVFLGKHRPEEAMQAVRRGNLDRGIFSIYFFNVVHARPGEAVFQGAGLPHAYLFGQNVELMSNSDNVLRGGLTSKHVDIPELMQHTRFEATHPVIMQGDKVEQGLYDYPCPVNDFSIERLEGAKGSHEMEAGSLDTWIIIEGDLELNAGEESLPLRRGEAGAVPAGTAYRVDIPNCVLAYRAYVPAH